MGFRWEGGGRESGISGFDVGCGTVSLAPRGLKGGFAGQGRAEPKGLMMDDGH